MSQISPPVRIVIVAALAFLAAWMLVLRPKSEAASSPAPAATATATAKQPGTTAQSAAGKAVQAAANAKATAEAAARASAGESTATSAAATAAPAATATAKPAATLPGVDPAALRTLPRDVRAALVARKIVVIGFFERTAADDRATRTELAHASRWHGRAAVFTAPVAHVQRYQVITRGVDVAQSPAIVVIDRDRKAALLTGYVDRVTIDQSVLDAMRRSGMAIIRSSYLRQVNDLCSANGRALDLSFKPTSSASLRAWVRDSSASYRSFVARFDRLPAPARYRAFKAGLAKDLHVETAALGALAVALKSGSSSRLSAVGARYDKPLAAAGKRIQTRARRHELLACTYD